MTHTRARTRSWLTAGVGLSVTLAVALIPTLRFAYRSPEGHLVLETAISLVGGLVALLLYGRYRRTAAVTDLLLMYSMLLLALSALVLVALPAVVGAQVGQAATSWAALVVRFVAAVLLAVAALVSPQRRHMAAHPAREVLVLAIGAVVLGGAVAWLASGLPDVVEVRRDAETSGRPAFDAPPIVHIVQALNFVCYAVAAVAFTRRADQLRDELLGWVGAASALGACARLSFVLFPSLYTEWLYVGDVLRLGMYLLLLAGGVIEINRYWQAQATVAVRAERRRLARDLHDGVVQELGYIRGLALMSTDSWTASQVGAAADRALGEARRAVDALVAHPQAGLAEALTRAVAEVADRYDVAVALHDDGFVDDALGPLEREALLRIAREAVANAAKHAKSTSIAVRLSAGSLTVEDAGCGFDPQQGRPGGFGLTSMRERAEGMNALLHIDSTPGVGTQLRVSW